MCFTRTVQKNAEGDQATCRYDWHQTASHVVVSIFSKVPIPELSRVEANPVKLHLHITFGEDRCLFSQTFLLSGVCYSLISEPMLCLSASASVAVATVASLWSHMMLSLNKLSRILTRAFAQHLPDRGPFTQYHSQLLTTLPALASSNRRGSPEQLFFTWSSPTNSPLAKSEIIVVQCCAKHFGNRLALNFGFDLPTSLHDILL